MFCAAILIESRSTRGSPPASPFSRPAPKGSNWDKAVPLRRLLCWTQKVGMRFRSPPPLPNQLVFCDLQPRFLTNPRFLTIRLNSPVLSNDSERHCAANYLRHGRKFPALFARQSAAVAAVRQPELHRLRAGSPQRRVTAVLNPDEDHSSRGIPAGARIVGLLRWRDRIHQRKENLLDDTSASCAVGRAFPCNGRPFSST
jgi:hypothetical protein